MVICHSHFVSYYYVAKQWLYNKPIMGKPCWIQALTRKQTTLQTMTEPFMHDIDLGNGHLNLFAYFNLLILDISSLFLP